MKHTQDYFRKFSNKLIRNNSILIILRNFRKLLRIAQWVANQLTDLLRLESPKNFIPHY